MATIHPSATVPVVATPSEAKVDEKKYFGLSQRTFVLVIVLAVAVLFVLFIAALLILVPLITGGSHGAAIPKEPQPTISAPVLSVESVTEPATETTEDTSNNNNTVFVPAGGSGVVNIFEYFHPRYGGSVSNCTGPASYPDAKHYGAHGKGQEGLVESIVPEGDGFLITFSSGDTASITGEETPVVYMVRAGEDINDSSLISYDMLYGYTSSQLVPFLSAAINPWVRHDPLNSEFWIACDVVE